MGRGCKGAGGAVVRAGPGFVPCKYSAWVKTGVCVAEEKGRQSAAWQVLNGEAAAVKVWVEQSFRRG